MEHWLILIILACNIRKKLSTNDYTFWPLYFNTVATLPCEMQVVEPAVCQWCQRLPLAFALEEGILSTCCNKEDVM